MTTDTPTIQLKPSDTDLLAGPLLFGLIVGGPAAAGIGCLFWKPDELIDHWEVFLIFGVVFVLVFAVVRTINTTFAFWKIEHEAVYRGKKLLFHLNEIQEATKGCQITGSPPWIAYPSIFVGRAVSLYTLLLERKYHPEID